MTRIDQGMSQPTTAATTATTATATAAADSSSVLIPYNAPPSSSFDQVLQSISTPPSSAAGTASGSALATSGGVATPSTSTVTGTTAGTMAGTAGASGLGGLVSGGASSSSLPSTVTATPASPNPLSGQGSQSGCAGCNCGCGRGAAMQAMGLSLAAMGAAMQAMGLSMSGSMGATAGSAPTGAAATTAGTPASGTTGATSGLDSVQGAAAALGARLQTDVSPAPGFAMPFQGSAPVTQSFGPTPYLAEPAYDGYSHFHTGIDYGLPLGTTIGAAAGGTVVSAGWDNTGFGNCVIVDHGNGLRTLYGHLEKISVQPGDTVGAGQEIGLSGSTGNSSGPHLHFGVEKDGAWVDPAPYLAGKVSTPLAGAAGNPTPLTAATAPPSATSLPTSAGVSLASAVGASMASAPSVGGGAPAPASAGAASASGAANGSALDVTRLIKRVAATTGVPASLIGAVVQAESGGDPNAVSSAGAKGLMQLMDATAASYGVTNSFDPLQNVTGGATYLRSLLQRYHGDTTLAIAAYNAGPDAVDRYGGIPPYPETQQYVQRVTSLQKNADAAGTYQ